MKLLFRRTPKDVPLSNPRINNPHCPYCHEPMWEMGRSNAFDGKVNLAEEPKHCYRCRNEECSERPLYRRMDVEQGKADEQQQAADEARAQEHASFLALNEEMKVLAQWLRERRPSKLDSAPLLSSILITLLEEGQPK